MSADYGYASGLIVPSAPLKITEKFAPDGLWNGELVSMNEGKVNIRDCNWRLSWSTYIDWP